MGFIGGASGKEFTASAGNPRDMVRYLGWEDHTHTHTHTGTGRLKVLNRSKNTRYNVIRKIDCVLSRRNRSAFM